MKLIVISGRSGSGKSTALHALEDEGFNCIDNFPVTLLRSLVHNGISTAPDQNLAVCIDARSAPDEIDRFPELLESLDGMDVECEVVFLDAISDALVKRFSETRRRHPLTNDSMDLREAIDAERDVLANISDIADLRIDTSALTPQSLVDLVRSRIIERSQQSISLLFRSFGFRRGVPVDADFVYDIRCLPNPYWIDELRTLTGLDDPVRNYLDAEAEVTTMYKDICTFLESWLPRFEANNRAYITVALGCTGGQHRSVYMAEKLADHFRPKFSDVLVRHREQRE